MELTNTLEKALSVLKQNKIIISTIDKSKNPNVFVLDSLHINDENIYIITTKRTELYKDIKNNSKVAILTSGSDLQVKLKAEVKILGKNKKEDFLSQNPRFTNELVEVIKIKNAIGVISDLSKELKFPDKGRFIISKTKVNLKGYYINSNCKTCNKCYKVCPYDAITKGKKLYRIDPDKCVECGKCFKVCPHDAIEKPISV